MTYAHSDRELHHLLEPLDLASFSRNPGQIHQNHPLGTGLELDSEGRAASQPAHVGPGHGLSDRGPDPVEGRHSIPGNFSGTPAGCSLSVAVCEAARRWRNACAMPELA